EKQRSLPILFRPDTPLKNAPGDPDRKAAGLVARLAESVLSRPFRFRRPPDLQFPTFEPTKSQPLNCRSTWRVAGRARLPNARLPFRFSSEPHTAPGIPTGLAANRHHYPREPETKLQTVREAKCFLFPPRTLSERPRQIPFLPGLAQKQGWPRR